jgi:hypothetical protein
LITKKNFPISKQYEEPFLESKEDEDILEFSQGDTSKKIKTRIGLIARHDISSNADGSTRGTSN